MADIGTVLLEQSRAWLGLEGVAVVCAILYLLLAIRQHIGCWFFAGISTAIYVYLFLDARLYMESALNVFYFGMAIYGWYSWAGIGDDRHSGEMTVSQWSVRRHLIAIMLIILLSVSSGFLLDRNTSAVFPYVDSLTTWSALWATFLIARKVLENWWYWLLIDLASIFIYWSRDLQLTAMLFAVYVIMIPFGYLSWRKSMRPAFVGGVALRGWPWREFPGGRRRPLASLQAG